MLLLREPLVLCPSIRRRLHPLTPTSTSVSFPWLNRVRCRRLRLRVVARESIRPLGWREGFPVTFRRIKEGTEVALLDAELRVDTWFFEIFFNNLSMSSKIIIERFDRWLLTVVRANYHMTTFYKELITFIKLYQLKKGSNDKLGI